MSVDPTNALAVAAYVRAMEVQAEKSVQEKNFRAACVCYKQILHAVYEYFGELLKRSPSAVTLDRVATPEETYLSESQKWFEGLTRAMTEMLPPAEKSFIEPYNEFLFQNPGIADPATLISDAKKHLDADREFLLQNYVEGKVPSPIARIVRDFATGTTTRRETVRLLNECKERFKKCQRQFRSFGMLDIPPLPNIH